MKPIRQLICTLICLTVIPAAHATITYNISLMNGDNTPKPIGTITIDQTKHGLIITPHLTDLPPGLHGFHMHEHASCAHAAKDAGGHFDPRKTGKHLGPYDNKGHLGDLPALFVDDKGNASLPVFAPRLTLSDMKNHSLMIHAGGDNYSDNPKLGGGGDRIACGTQS